MRAAALLRRSSLSVPVPPIVPSALPNLAMWLKADALTGLVDDDPVSSWTDSSGNGRHATNTLTARPAYKTAILNGQPVVRFDGVDDALAVAFTLPQPVHLFIVAQYRMFVADATVIDGNQVNTMRLYRTAATTIKQYAGVVGPALTTTPAAWHIYTCLFSGAASELRAESDSPVTGNVGTASGGGVTIGATGLSGGNRFSFGAVDVAEVVVYSAALSTSDRRGVEAYLGTKYGIPV